MESKANKKGCDDNLALIVQTKKGRGKGPNKGKGKGERKGEESDGIEWITSLMGTIC
jgi:hypothetical protein